MVYSNLTHSLRNKLINKVYFHKHVKLQLMSKLWKKAGDCEPTKDFSTLNYLKSFSPSCTNFLLFCAYADPLPKWHFSIIHFVCGQESKHTPCANLIVSGNPEKTSCLYSLDKWEVGEDKSMWKKAMTHSLLLTPPIIMKAFLHSNNGVNG